MIENPIEVTTASVPVAADNYVTGVGNDRSWTMIETDRQRRVL